MDFEFLDFIKSWPIWLQIICFFIAVAVGVGCLVWFSNIMVDAASAIAHKLHMSPILIGLTVIAMGTSLPELAISATDAISCLVAGGNAHANMAIGNVVGSNICNLLLVLGFSLIFTPIIVKKDTRKSEIPLLLGVTAITTIFVCLFGLNHVASYEDLAITRWEGIILVVGIIAYITFLIIKTKKHPETAETNVQINDMPWWKAIILLVFGIAGIILGGEFVVYGAKGIALQGATSMGINHDLAESLVGLTVVAIGTSLPELVTSIVAAKKGQNQIALGNVIGSNIFNCLFVLGISGTISPLTSGGQVIIDALVTLSVTVLVAVMAFSGKLKRWHGAVLLGCYVAYLTYLILRTVLAGV